MKSLLAVAFLLISAQAFAYDQTFESCSLTAWSIFENLQQYQLHVPLEKLKATKCKDGVPKYATECTNVDTAYSMAKSEGIDTAYIAAHVHYIKCSGEVQSRVGRGPLPQLESGYRECARSSGARANILAAIKHGTPIEVTRDKMGAPYYDLIDTLFRKARDINLTSVLDESARAAMACIEAVEATGRSSSEQPPDNIQEVTNAALRLKQPAPYVSPYSPPDPARANEQWCEGHVIPRFDAQGKPVSCDPIGKMTDDSYRNMLEALEGCNTVACQHEKGCLRARIAHEFTPDPWCALPPSSPSNSIEQQQQNLENRIDSLENKQ
ncbi:MAG: hypothetical protein ACLPXB_17035 [Thiobacillaceae bacterium]